MTPLNRPGTGSRSSRAFGRTPEKDTAPEETLLAVDAGERTGLALFGRDGRLMWYRSQNYGNRSRLRQAVHSLMRGECCPTHLAIEGGGPIADIWIREAERAGAAVILLSAEQWRKRIMLPREQRSGAEAKRAACETARRFIEVSGAPRPTSMRHDTAEAILAGLWAMLELGWIERLPWEQGATPP